MRSFVLESCRGCWVKTKYNPAALARMDKGKKDGDHSIKRGRRKYGESTGKRDEYSASPSV